MTSRAHVTYKRRSGTQGKNFQGQELFGAGIIGLQRVVEFPVIGGVSVCAHRLMIFRQSKQASQAFKDLVMLSGSFWCYLSLLVIWNQFPCLPSLINA